MTSLFQEIQALFRERADAERAVQWMRSKPQTMQTGSSRGWLVPRPSQEEIEQEQALLSGVRRLYEYTAAVGIALEMGLVEPLLGNEAALEELLELLNSIPLRAAWEPKRINPLLEWTWERLKGSETEPLSDCAGPEIESLFSEFLVFVHSWNSNQRVFGLADVLLSSDRSLRAATMFERDYSLEQVLHYWDTGDKTADADPETVPSDPSLGELLAFTQEFFVFCDECSSLLQRFSAVSPLLAGATWQFWSPLFHTLRGSALLTLRYLLHHTLRWEGFKTQDHIDQLLKEGTELIAGRIAAPFEAAVNQRTSWRLADQTHGAFIRPSLSLYDSLSRREEFRKVEDIDYLRIQERPAESLGSEHGASLDRFAKEPHKDGLDLVEPLLRDLVRLVLERAMDRDLREKELSLVVEACRSVCREYLLEKVDRKEESFAHKALARAAGSVLGEEQDLWDRLSTQAEVTHYVNIRFLFRALGRALEESDYALLLLRDGAGFELEEIAEYFRSSPSRVESRYHDMFKRARTLLEITRSRFRGIQEGVDIRSSAIFHGYGPRPSTRVPQWRFARLVCEGLIRTRLTQPPSRPYEFEVFLPDLAIALDRPTLVSILNSYEEHNEVPVNADLAPVESWTLGGRAYRLCIWADFGNAWMFGELE